MQHTQRLAKVFVPVELYSQKDGYISLEINLKDQYKVAFNWEGERKLCTLNFFETDVMSLPKFPNAAELDQSFEI